MGNLDYFFTSKVVTSFILIIPKMNCGVVDPCATNKYEYPNPDGKYNVADLSLLGYPAHHIDKRMAESNPISSPQYSFDSRHASPQYLPCKLLQSLKTMKNYD